MYIFLKTYSLLSFEFHDFSMTDIVFHAFSMTEFEFHDFPGDQQFLHRMAAGCASLRQAGWPQAS